MEEYHVLSLVKKDSLIGYPLMLLEVEGTHQIYANNDGWFSLEKEINHCQSGNDLKELIESYSYSGSTVKLSVWETIALVENALRAEFIRSKLLGFHFLEDGTIWMYFNNENDEYSEWEIHSDDIDEELSNFLDKITQELTRILDRSSESNSD